MIKHLKSELHFDKEYQELIELERNSNRPGKRRRLNFDIENTPTDSPNKKLPDMGVLTIQQKFKPDSLIQHERMLKIVVMLVKCMLPISLVEHKAFREYISYIDPSFNMPSGETVKLTGLPKLCQQVNERMKLRLTNISWVNVSLDLWSDAILRPYNGLICQGNMNNLI